MNISRFFPAYLGAAALAALVTGCQTDNYGSTSPYHPGPVAGKAVGTGVGVVAGNVVGAGVGVVEGTAHGLAKPFDPSYHMVRQWTTETTADGRTIQVPHDILVDSMGRPVAMPAPTYGTSPAIVSGTPTNAVPTNSIAQ